MAEDACWRQGMASHRPRWTAGSQELKLRKPQAVSSRSPHVPCVRAGSTLQVLEANQCLWESFWHI